MKTEAKTNCREGVLRGIVILLMIAVVACNSSTSFARTGISGEYLIKAAYLYNFAMFAEWPSDAFAAPDAPIVIGIVGPDPFGSALDLTVQDKKIDKRRLIIKRLNWSDDIRQSHILFIGASETARFGELAHRLSGLPILTVGESADFIKRGGTANFTIEDKKVRFEINTDAALRARLKISSKLLNLARIVRPN